MNKNNTGLYKIIKQVLDLKGYYGTNFKDIYKYFKTDKNFRKFTLEFYTFAFLMNRYYDKNRKSFEKLIEEKLKREAGIKSKFLK